MKKLSYIFGSIAMSLLPAFAKADDATTESFNFKLTERGPGGNLTTFVQGIVDWLLLLVGALAVLFIILGGVQLITSAGNVKRVDTAKKTLTYAIFGLVIILLTKLILVLITKAVLPAIFGSGTVSI